MASISKTVRPKRSSNTTVSPTGYGLTVGRGTPTVSTPGGAGWLANKPASYTNVISNLSLTMAVPGGNGGGAISTGTERAIPGASPWTIIYDADGSGNPNSSNFSLITDSSEPSGVGSAWRLNFLAGTYPDGTGHGNIGRAISGAPSNLYLAYTIKYDASFIWHAISNKHVEFEQPGGGFLFQSFEGTAGGMWWRGHNYNPEVDYVPQINTAITLGVWHIVEILLEEGSPGVLRVWIDGVLRSNFTSTVSLNVTAFSMRGHRGGGGETIAHNCWYDLGHIYLATV